MKNLADSNKNRIFADEEPTALAYTDFTKVTPTLEGDDAVRFVENMIKTEKKVEERRNIPPSLEKLEEELKWNKFFLEQDIKLIEERKIKIQKLENKIKEIKQQNGKREEE